MAPPVADSETFAVRRLLARGSLGMDSKVQLDRWHRDWQGNVAVAT